MNTAKYAHWSSSRNTGATFEVLEKPDLRIEKGVSQGTLLPGDEVTYTLEYSNEGPSVARGVVITDVVPASVTQVLYDSSGAGLMEVGVEDYVWSAEDLAFGVGGAITVSGY